MAELNRKPKISRRSFTRGVAFAATAVAVRPNLETVDAQSTEQTQSADLDCRFQALLRKYGGRLSEEEKSDIKRLLGQAQKAGDALRSFALANSDEPATVFKVYRPQVRKMQSTTRSNRRGAR